MANVKIKAVRQPKASSYDISSHYDIDYKDSVSEIIHKALDKEFKYIFEEDIQFIELTFPK